MTAFDGAPVLVVDDDPDVIDAIEKALGAAGFAVRSAHNGQEALARLAESAAEVVVTDFEMPGMDGLALLKRVRELSPHTQRILLSGKADPSEIEQASREGYVDRFIPKPFTVPQLRIAVRSAVAQHRLDVENARLHTELEARVQQRTAQLENAKQEWEASFDAISDPLAIVSPGRVVKRANRAYAGARKLDIRALPGSKCHEALFGRTEVCEGCPLDRAEASREPAPIRIGRRSIKVWAWPLKGGDTVCFYRDVTAEEEAARQLIQNAKLTATGQLAAGVAHEVNNPLASILAFSQLMKDEPGRSASDFEALRLISSSALRCKHIVETLLRFVRRSESVERGPADLNFIVDEAAALMRPQIKGLDVKLIVEHPREQTWVDANSNQLAQVAINLLQNAVHAVGVKGVITLSCGPRGEHMILAVKDDGSGISQEVRARIFEPFFTTKAEGVGTGLGLSIVHRIVEEHGGVITVESEPGQGATFTMVLPPLRAGP